MNSDNLIDLMKKITYPFDSNKYISGTLLIILLINASYYIPQPLLPNILVNELKKYGLLSFIFTLLLSYLLTKDINVSIIASLLIFGLYHLNLKIKNFQNTDNMPLLINEYNYNLDRVKQKDDIRSDQIKLLLNNKPSLSINNNTTNTTNTINEEPIFDINYDESKQLQNQILNNNNDDFKFTEDNLRYLHHNPKK